MTAEGSNQRGGWQVVGQVITEGMSSGWEGPSFSHSTILGTQTVSLDDT